MASTERPGLFGFASLPIPADAQGAYRTGLTVMRVQGWLTVVLVALYALVATFILVAALAFGGTLTAFLNDVGGPWASLGGIAIIAIGIIVFVFFAVLITIMLVLLAWMNRIYAAWLTRRQDAPARAKTFATVCIVLAGLALLGALGTFDITSLLVQGAYLACAIMLLVNAGQAEADRAFGPPAAPAPA